MNLYTVETTDERTEDVEADLYERVGDDWVFYAHLEEVYRVPINDVVGLVKVSQAG